VSDRAAITFDMSDVDSTHARLVDDDGSTVALSDVSVVRSIAAPHHTKC